MNEISSRTNETIRRVAALCADAALRRAQGLCVVHGIKLCAEAARRTQLTALYVTDNALKKYAREIAALGVEDMTLVSEPVLERIDPLRTPQGVVGVARLPQAAAPGELAAGRRILALCSVQDPANVGAAVRTAAALGYAGVALSDDCADLFSPKALRASMGAAFAVKRTIFADGAAFARFLSEEGVLCVATALREDARPVTAVDTAGRLALFIGNEGRGLSSDIINACGACAVIPITGDVESLNAGAAAAIAMWELRDGR
ncbi:MAG: RNA methyltransferase [Oscillospiraceae bacterium]|nr:RNA methyltransferase [Oscillospiraceae bacterium]